MNKFWSKCLFIVVLLISAGSLAWLMFNRTVLPGKQAAPVQTVSQSVYTGTLVPPPASSQSTPTVPPLEAKQQSLEAIYQKSYQAFHNKQYAEAISLANQIIGQDDQFFKAYNIKGITLCYSKNFNEGMKNIDRALAINPNYEYARFNKALAYELYGQYNLALDWYTKALAIEPDVWSYYGIASIYGRRGDVNNTIKYLQLAVNMDQTIKGFAKEERDFNPVKNSKEFKALVNAQ